MKKLFFNIAILMSLASLLMVGCQKDNLLDNSKFNTIITVKPNNAKTTYSPESGDVIWTLGEEGEGGDQINVFRGNTSADGAFTILSLENGVASFGGNLDTDATGLYYAVYPYQEDMSIEDGVVSCLVINPEQELVSGSFGDGANTSCGFHESTTMKFSNIGALAKIYVRGNVAIKSISITDNTNQVIGGYGTIDIPELTFNLNTNGSSKITAEAPTAAGIPAVESGQTFYLVMPPCTLSNFTVDITDVDGVVHTKTYTESADQKVFTRAQVTLIGSYTVNGSTDPAATSIPDDEIWYTTLNNRALTLNSTDGFGANIVSNTYSDGKGVIKLDGTVRSVGESAFQDCITLTSITLPDSITSIYYRAFSGCKWLASVDLPQALYSIGYEAFKGCSSLTAIDLPDHVTSIEMYAFYLCSSLASIDIPSGVTTIGMSTFSGCSSLTHVGIPNSVTTIMINAFSWCSSLASITIPNSVTSIEGGAFSSCTALTSISLPNRLSVITNGMFKGCISLTSVTIPESVESIGSEAFRDCTSLASISLPDELYSIGVSAFYSSGLQSITIPSGVFDIGNMAFSNCSSLGTVVSKPTTPPDAGNQLFDLYDEQAWEYIPNPNLCIKVPAGSVDEYKAATGWSEYADYIQAIQ